MNFQDLLTKIKQIDEGGVVECGDEIEKAPKPGLRSDEIPLMGEKSIEECGDMPGDLMHPPKQQDNVTMNVSMNGSGAGGIKDLIGILRNIEGGTSSHGDDHDNVLVGMDETQPDGGFGSTDNEKNTTTLDISAMTGSGNDLHGNQGDHNDDRYAGFAPVANPVSENLVKRLAEMYAEIKGEPIEEAGIMNALGQLGGAVAGTVANGANAVGNAVSGAYDSAKQGVKNAANAVGNAVTSVTDPLVQGAKTGYATATGAQQSQSASPSALTTPEQIKAFQQANGLTADGIIGPKTLAVMKAKGIPGPAAAPKAAAPAAAPAAQAGASAGGASPAANNGMTYKVNGKVVDKATYDKQMAGMKAMGGAAGLANNLAQDMEEGAELSDIRRLAGM